MSALTTAIQLIRPAALRLAWRYCPVCQRNRLIIRLNNNEIAVRCVTCRASLVSMSIAAVISRLADTSENLAVYELSARGPLLGYLRHRFGEVTCSEYFPGHASGELVDGVLCQDVQRLSFADGSFDLCTSTDVFEHVPDDRTGFANVCRVLKPGGYFIFTVPLQGEKTITRAQLCPDGSINHLLPPEYHGDPVSESGRILAFRNYGADIVSRLVDAGFSKASIEKASLPGFWGLRRPVVVARK